MGERLNHFVERVGGYFGGEPLRRNREDETAVHRSIEENNTTLARNIKRLIPHHKKA